MRSTSIIGGSSAINVTLGIVRTKVLAVLLGPSGIGLLGMYTAVLGTVGTIAGMGLGNSGTRQIAAAVGRGDRQAVADARAALWRLTLAFGIGGAVLLAVAAPSVSRLTFGTASQAVAVAVLGIGLAASVVTGSQTALLTGLRRIGDVARASIWGGLLGTTLAIVLVLAFGEKGVLPLVVSIPCSGLAVATFFAARAGRRELPPSPAWKAEALAMLKLGASIMVSGALSSATLLAVRSVLVQRMGLEANGQFQAAWAISMTYLGFVLSAMGTDYYPRVAGAIHDRSETARIVGDQTEAVLLIAGPIILAMTALAPLVVTLFYSARFDAAVPILRWQMLGNVLKVASWPAAFTLLASGAAGTYFLVELSWNAVFLAVVLLTLGKVGLVATGGAFAVAYAVYLAVVFVACGHRAGPRWRRAVVGFGGVTLLLVAGVLLAEVRFPVAAHVGGVLFAFAFGAYSLRRLATASGLDGNAVVASIRRHLPWSHS